MARIKWNLGPPPSIGWWPASKHRNPTVLRWWNGERWSMAVTRYLHPGYINYYATTPADPADVIFWAERPRSWPERSRT